MAYVGPSVLGSAIAMDKDVAKKLVSYRNTIGQICHGDDHTGSGPSQIMIQAEEQLKFPVYVKPASLGSSVGITKADKSADLKAAIDEAFRYDHKILVEEGINGREIEFAALGGFEPQISSPGEVVAEAGFYTYDEKYSDSSKSEVVIPAPMPDEDAKKGRELASQAFQALNLYGMSRSTFSTQNQSLSLTRPIPFRALPVSLSTQCSGNTQEFLILS